MKEIWRSNPSRIFNNHGRRLLFPVPTVRVIWKRILPTATAGHSYLPLTVCRGPRFYHLRSPLLVRTWVVSLYADARNVSFESNLPQAFPMPWYHSFSRVSCCARTIFRTIRDRDPEICHLYPAAQATHLHLPLPTGTMPISHKSSDSSGRSLSRVLGSMTGVAVGPSRLHVELPTSDSQSMPANKGRVYRVVGSGTVEGGMEDVTGSSLLLYSQGGDC